MYSPYDGAAVGPTGEDRRVPALTWMQICARRLARQALLAPAPDAATAVGSMCGAHAQIPSAAELSVGLRLAGATRSDIRRAVWDDRTLVRTHGPRGTVHLLPTSELPMWTGALSAVPHTTSMPAGIRLDAGQVDAIVAAAADAVAQDDLTLDELDHAISQRCGAWAGERVMPAFQGLWPRWRQVMSTASHRGALCFGPSRGRAVTYSSPRRWLPDLAPLPAGEAVAALLHAYLHTYGPAQPADFARWLAAPTGWAGAVFDERRAAIEPVDCAGWTAWVNAGDTAPTDADADGVWLLPYFDAYVVGSYPRDRVFPGRAAERALARTQAGNFPVLLVAGETAGVWHQRRSGRRIAITVEPLRPMTPRHRRALDEAVQRIGMIGEGRAELTVGPVDVGAHA